MYDNHLKKDVMENKQMLFSNIVKAWSNNIFRKDKNKS